MSLLFEDEFSGPAGARPDQSKWKPVDGLRCIGNHELEHYTSRAKNVSLDGGGRLRLIARRETFGSGADQRAYTSGMVESRFGFRYGTALARIKLPAGRGLWPAFWMLPATDSTDPLYDELDIMEVLGHEPAKLYGTAHGKGWKRGGTVLADAPLSSAYHLYGLTWSDRCIHWTLDGVPYASLHREDVAWGFDQPFYLILNLAVGGDWPGPPDADTVFPATMWVDWVRVYGQPKDMT